MTKKALICVDSYVGSGHLNAMILLARALQEKGIEVTMATGNVRKDGSVDYSLDMSGIKTVALPGLERDGLRTQESREYARFNSDWHEERKATLEDLIHKEKFDTVITETWPFSLSPLYKIQMLGVVQAAHDVGAKLYACPMDRIQRNGSAEFTKGFRKQMWGKSAGESGRESAKAWV